MSRRPVHTRSIRVEAFARDDGLWDLEASLDDIKAHDFVLANSVRARGEPIHALRLVVTIDTAFNVVDARSYSTATPYPGECDTFNDAYTQLVGLNLTRAFRERARERLGGVRGCTHLTELCAVLPTVAIQAFANEVYRTHDAARDGIRALASASDEANRPFQIDRCRALRRDGAVVARFYPRWARPGATEPSSDLPRSFSE